MLNPNSSSEKQQGLGLAIAVALGALTFTLSGCVEERAEAAIETAPQGPTLADKLAELASLNSAEAFEPNYRYERRIGELQRRDTLFDALNRIDIRVEVTHAHFMVI